MELEPIDPIEPELWDRIISRFESKRIFHSSAWLRFIEETWSVKPLRFRILQDGTTEGFFVGIRVRRGLFNLLGSPLTGWNTDFLGPIVNPGTDLEEFLRALERLCRRSRIHFVSIGNPVLEPGMMRRFGFNTSRWKTFSISLSPDPHRMWERLTSRCRNRIRKGIKNGLVAEDCDDPAFVDQFLEQHADVFASQHLPPKHSMKEVRNLYRHLKPADRLFSLRVKHGHRTIATGIFPHDDHFMHSFSIASGRSALHLCPNELLYWKAMCLAGERGITTFCIGGPYSSVKDRARFKEKFNGHETTLYRFGKSFSAFGYVGHKTFQAFQSLVRRAGFLPGGEKDG